MTNTSAEADPVFEGAMPGNGETVRVSPLIRRRICPNAGPFTASGTCTYIVGAGEVAILDPGPADPDHVAALVAEIAGERLCAIVVTHTHRDHSPGARLLRDLTGAPIVGCGPHRAARGLAAGELRLDAGSDLDHAPDRIMSDGETLSGPGWTLRAVATPGHTVNHLAFALDEEKALFSGDHVMAWSTTIVGPPDGSMTAFMASLERLRGRADRVYWPGHGGPVRDPRRFVRALGAHRRQRETAIRGRIEAGDRDVRAIVAAIYQSLNPALIGAAALSVFAHLEDLVEQGAVVTDGPPRLDGVYAPGRAD